MTHVWPKSPQAPPSAEPCGVVHLADEVVAAGQPYGRRKSNLGEPPAAPAAPAAVVDETVCELCGVCQAVCPTEAIALTEVAVRVNGEACCGCGACVEACPSGAITLT